MLVQNADIDDGGVWGDGADDSSNGGSVSASVVIDWLSRDLGEMAASIRPVEPRLLNASEAAFVRRVNAAVDYGDFDGQKLGVGERRRNRLQGR